MSYFAPYIDGSGIHMPTYEDRLQDLCSAYRTIFGQEAELTPAVPDYQLLSVLAKALDDTSAFVVSVYNSRNPAYASGQALDLLLPQYGSVRNAGGDRRGGPEADEPGNGLPGRFFSGCHGSGAPENLRRLPAPDPRQR